MSHPHPVADPSLEAPEGTSALVSALSAEEAKELEQRARHRHLGGTVTLTRLSLASAEEVSYFAWVHDISENGIGLDVLGPLGAGVDIVFSLKGSGENEKIRLHARVVHATRAGSLYRLGCRFTLPLRPAVLAAIVDKIHARE